MLRKLSLLPLEYRKVLKDLVLICNDNPLSKVQYSRGSVIWCRNYGASMKCKVALIGLGLPPIFVCVIREEIITPASFSTILANYTSEESLINVCYDENNT